MTTAEKSVDLQLELAPDGIVESVGDKLGIVERRVTKDLENFKRLIEERGQPTGEWRGEVPREG